MKIQLPSHYSGVAAGRAQYAPGVYDTTLGAMPLDLAAYLVETGHAVLLEDAPPVVETVTVTEPEQTAPPVKKGRKS